MTAPRVAVGLFVYNGERHIRAAIDSLLGQTMEDFVLDISDNASTDLTEEICRSYMAADPRVRYVRQPENRGLTSQLQLCRATVSRYRVLQVVRSRRRLRADVSRAMRG